MYIATQYHSFELYEFEKKLIPKNNKNPQQDNDLRSRQELDAWMSYIDYLEIKQYPIKFIELVYYRFYIMPETIHKPGVNLLITIYIMQNLTRQEKF